MDSSNNSFYSDESDFEEFDDNEQVLVQIVENMDNEDSDNDMADAQGLSFKIWCLRILYLF